MGEGAAETSTETPERPLDVEHLFQELDGNKDGRLDRRELEACHPLPHTAHQLQHMHMFRFIGRFSFI